MLAKESQSEGLMKSKVWDIICGNYVSFSCFVSCRNFETTFTDDDCVFLVNLSILNDSVNYWTWQLPSANSHLFILSPKGFLEMNSINITDRMKWGFIPSLTVCLITDDSLLHFTCFHVIAYYTPLLYSSSSLLTLGFYSAGIHYRNDSCIL